MWCYEDTIEGECGVVRIYTIGENVVLHVLYVDDVWRGLYVAMVVFFNEYPYKAYPPPLCYI